MRLVETFLEIPLCTDGDYFQHLANHCAALLPAGAAPVRFVVSKTTETSYQCEVGYIEDATLEVDSIFDFAKRSHENQERFSAVFIIPTGIGSDIGGHAGDAGPIARLLAAACDTLITHPNVVNASDINELPENGLYVEGSVISRLLMGQCGLRRTRSNRILTVMDRRDDPNLNAPTVNAAGAARSSMGTDTRHVVTLDPPLRMRAFYTDSGRAAGEVDGLDHLIEVLRRHEDEYDAFALASYIQIKKGLYKAYLEAKGEIVNPWGGVEAMLTHAVSLLLNKPSAHAPMIDDMELLCSVSGVVDPRMAAEELSCAFIHCVMKGLHRSPRIVGDKSTFDTVDVISAKDVSCMVIPDKCLGLPTLAAMRQGIPVIVVKENGNHMDNDLSRLDIPGGRLIFVETYLEAAGVMTALRAGVSVDSIRRPLSETVVTFE